MIKINFKNKIILVIIFINILFGLTIIFSIVKILLPVLKNEILQRGLLLGRNLAARSVNLILTEDILKLDELINTEKASSEDIVYVFISDLNKNIIVHTFKNEFPINLKDANSVSKDKINNISFLETNEGFIYDIAIPVLIKNELIATVRIGITENKIKNTVNKTIQMIITIMFIILLLSILIGFIISNKLLKPIKILQQATKKIAKGDLDIRVDIKTGDEIQNFTETFNLMIEKLKDAKNNIEGKIRIATEDLRKSKFEEEKKSNQLKQQTEELLIKNKKIQETSDELEKTYNDLKTTQANLMQSEKMSALGQLAGGVAHEINNPLTGILGFTQLLMMDVKKDTQQYKDLHEIEQLVLRCKKIISALLSFSRQESKDMKIMNIHETIESTKEICGYQIGLKNIKIIQKLEAQIPEIIGNSQQISQVFINLIVNAKDAIPDGGTITITTRNNYDETNQQVIEVLFTDTGTGIPEEIIDKVFDPFFTTKPVGQGTGLGLSLCQGIIGSHKGKIRVESKVGIGTTFIIAIPVKKNEI